MEFLYIFIGITIGAIGGFFISKRLSASEQDVQRLEQEAQRTKSSLEEYRQEVAEHLNSSAKLLEQMNATCKSAMEQMEKSTLLLNKASEESVPSAPFFSEEATKHMRDPQRPRKKLKSTKAKDLTEPPLDYANQPSGIFNDSKQIVTNSPS